jgi:hypothetical protein
MKCVQTIENTHKLAHFLRFALIYVQLSLFLDEPLTSIVFSLILHPMNSVLISKKVRGGTSLHLVENFRELVRTGSLTPECRLEPDHEPAQGLQLNGASLRQALSILPMLEIADSQRIPSETIGVLIPPLDFSGEIYIQSRLPIELELEGIETRKPQVEEYVAMMAASLPGAYTPDPLFGDARKVRSSGAYHKQGYLNRKAASRQRYMICMRTMSNVMIKAEIAIRILLRSSASTRREIRAWRRATNGCVLALRKQVCTCSANNCIG